MRSTRLNYIIVGSFVLAMLLAAVAGLALVSGRTGPTDPYYVVMDNVADVKFGTQVRYEGFPIGQVVQVTPFANDGRMRFRIELTVERDWRIPSDSVARVTAPNLLAAKTLDIQAGVADVPLKPGGEIASAAPIDMFITMRSMAGELSTLNQDGLQPLILDLRQAMAQINKLLAGDVAQTAASIRDLTGSLDQAAPDIAGNLQELTARLNNSAATVENLLSPANRELMQQILHNVELGSLNFAAMTTDLQRSASDLQQIIMTVNELIDSNAETLDGTLEDARYTLRTVSQNIDGIVHNLQGTARNMSEFSRLIRQNPGLLLNSRPRPDIETATGPAPQ